MLTDEQLNSTFYKFAIQEGDDEPELMDYECAEKFARAIEKQVQLETVEKLQKVMECNYCAFATVECVPGQDECISNLMTFVRGEG